MYQYKKNRIEINGNAYEFEFEIRSVVQYKENYIVLLTIPYSSKEINNIYSLDAEAKIKWRVEDLACKFPKLKNLLPYEDMGLKDDKIYATDFYGRNFALNAETGEIDDYSIVK